MWRISDYYVKGLQGLQSTLYGDNIEKIGLINCFIFDRCGDFVNIKLETLDLESEHRIWVQKDSSVKPLVGSFYAFVQEYADQLDDSLGFEVDFHYMNSDSAIVWEFSKLTLTRWVEFVKIHRCP